MTTPRIHTLPNGVRVICDPMPGLETLALSVVAGRGAASEDLHRSGWSHLLEHMVFKGAGARTAREIVEVVEGAGGQVNAATGYERTSFQIRALKGSLPLGMDILADLVLRPTLDPRDLIKEKSVVAQEIAEAGDTPDDLVFELAQAAAYPDQPHGRPILGTPKSLKPADVAAIDAWRAALYAPDRLVVSAAGAVDEDELLRLAEAAFGSQPAGQGAPTPAAPQFTAGHAAKLRRLEQAHLVLLLPAFGARDDDYFPLRLFVEMLGGGMSSRLFQEARENRGLAYAIDAWSDTYADGGMLGVYAGCAAKDAGPLAALTAQQIIALTDGCTDAELARAKAQLKAHLFMAREQPLSRTETSAGQALLLGRLFPAREISEAIDAVTAADIARVGARMLKPGLVAGSVLGSKASLGAVDVFAEALKAG
ncbi:pitrilysin family protein [Caulobacter sp. NIBR1757]|uniref:M16 family metallopeptidase n=1 Tax=Caulobacter sp. NIBR1757 TaxID=3016000 RepID=UPI0022F03B5D|nr:pitrilysin family protein [Caulobacter sp. NIBR1757]WGM37927.1 putative zinc protease [Caulobacter sp. NIBR1757]